MIHKTQFSLDLGKQSETYFNLLSNEDFDFKTKKILINITKSKNTIEVDISCNSILDLKIANSAIIRSLEIIEKTLKI